ncbi:MAG: signal recognition particle-docking protein FtsY [Acidimicrobiia bacterium]|nr:signal recognition particle-docking protein FtsY [Acidimicrobiia bacterium]
MSTVLILAIVIFVVVLAGAGFFVWRGGHGRDGESPAEDVEGSVVALRPESTEPPPRPAPPNPEPETETPAPPVKRRRRGRKEPSDDDIASVVAAAEEILRGTGGEADDTRPDAETEPETEPGTEADASEAAGERRPSFRQRLGRTRKALGERLAHIRLKRRIDDETWDELEEMLILADVGADVASDLVGAAREQAAAEKADSPDAVLECLKQVMHARLAGRDRELSRSQDGPSVWFMVGVNGTGKTTTIGKIASRSADEGESVVIAAADTFRAAAADQLEIWAERSGAEVVRGQEGADPGAVVFDAVSLTRARGCDLLLVDTAGRLHTKVNLMEELKKIRRTAAKAGGDPDEVLLVLDATTGQNGLSQARQFTEAAGVTGVVLTKLDGTAKGGIAFAIEQEFGLPIKLVGLGETADDLVEFDPDEFVEALFA